MILLVSCFALLFFCIFNLFLPISAMKRYDALAALGAAGMVDIQNVIKWIGKWKLLVEKRFLLVFDGGR